MIDGLLLLPHFALKMGEEGGGYILEPVPSSLLGIRFSAFLHILPFQYSCLIHRLSFREGVIFSNLYQMNFLISVIKIRERLHIRNLKIFQLFIILTEK